MRRPGRRARRVIAGGVVAAVVGVGYAAYAANADAPSYRTTSATTGSVEQILAVSGSVEPAGRADLAFATSGTIESIEVVAGDSVTAGQVLGELDDTGLRKTLQQARASLASARAQLESDEDAQADTVSSASSSSTTGGLGTGSAPSTGGSSTPTGTGTSTPTGTPTDTPSDTPSDTPGTPSDGGLSDALAELAAEQQAVVAAQSTVSASLAAAQDALAAQQTACADAFSTDPTDDPTTDPTDGATTDPGTGAGSDDATNQACSDALTAVQTAQQQVSTDQDALQDALDDLSGTLTEAITALQQSGGSTGTPSTGSGQSGTPSTGTSGSGTSGSGTSGSGTSGSGVPSTGSGSTSGSTSGSGAATTGGGSSFGGATVTAATLADDQAAIDQAEADVITARQALRTATVRAPFAGQVVAVDAAEGDSVSSGTEVFILVAPGTTTVQIDATSSQVQQMKVGQSATATPAGSDEALAGTVTQISTVPDDSSTYPVTITLTKKDLDSATGLNASVSIVTGTAKDVVTVPASAVSDGVVTVVDSDGNATRTRVTTGVIGATTVEITEGLEAGEKVVLADLKQALPTTDDSSSNQRGSFGGGSFPGGGAGFSPPTGGGSFPGR